MGKSGENPAQSRYGVEQRGVSSKSECHGSNHSILSRKRKEKETVWKTEL